MRPVSDPHRRGLAHRWLAGCGVVLLAAAVVVVVVLPVIVPPLPEPHLPPAPATGPGSMTRGLQKASEARAPQPGAGESEDVAPAGAARPAVADGAAKPIVELRRVQGRTRLPESSGPADGVPELLPKEFDRSTAARRRGVLRFGGTPHSESAVEAGLAWLAAHQARDGTWDRFHFADRDPPGDRCSGEAVRRTETPLRPGLTGLCLLAFLGAGYTDTEGPYQPVVRQAVEALLAMQQPHGGFWFEDQMAGYNDSLATFALAEYYAMTVDQRVVAPLRRAVGRLVGAQQALGGWDYEALPNTGRNDTSITAWVLQALHACAAAGIEVPRQTLVRAALHFQRATEADGRVWYADASTGFELDDNMQPVYRYGPAMTAAGLMSAQLLGWRLEGPQVRRQAALLLSQPPSEREARGGDGTQLHSEYYWYYGTVAMFQRGGADWERWNAQLRDVILPLQNRTKTAEGRRSSAYGSWDPYGEYWGLWGKMGSRVYTTAICTLTLEIYYRHTPAYLTEGLLISPEDWLAYLGGAEGAARRQAVSCLEHWRVEVAEPVLIELLRDPDEPVALAAAAALAWLDSPRGLVVLEARVEQLPAWERRELEPALRRAREVAALPAVAGTVRAFDAARGLATLELERAYVGMAVSVQRGGRQVAELRVIRRFTGRTAVVAELIAPATAEVRVGDVASGR